MRESCPQNRRQELMGKKTRRGKSRDKKEKQWRVVEPRTDSDKQDAPPPTPDLTRTKIARRSLLGTAKDLVMGETSNTPSYLQVSRPRSSSGASKTSNSDIQPDSSDVESSDSELEEGEFSRFEPDFELMKNKKRFSGLKERGGKSPKIN